MCSDIPKAFQMIEVDEQDRNALNFLWWENIAHDKQVMTYQHKRVIFGVNCSPFILGAVFAHHCESVAEDEKPYATKLMKSLYVDNCVTSVESNEEYMAFKESMLRISLPTVKCC